VQLVSIVAIVPYARVTVLQTLPMYCCRIDSRRIKEALCRTEELPGFVVSTVDMSCSKKDMRPRV
jgi:hypothetical protein